MDKQAMKEHMKEQGIIGIVGPAGLVGECMICSKVISADTTHLFYFNKGNPILICKICLDKYIENKEE